MHIVLKTSFLQLLQGYPIPNKESEKLWLEITIHYNNPNRHYHNLTHLSHLLLQINEVIDFLKNKDAILFALYYHDIIYDPQQQDNEEQSALFAVEILSSFSVSKEIIENCKEAILATKHHKISNNTDFNYFTDADLSILGTDWNTYNIYAQNIRKE